MAAAALPELSRITTRTGLVFDAWVAGPPEGALVLMLHGYPQSRHTWRAQLPVLAAAGRCNFSAARFPQSAKWKVFPKT